MDMDSWLWLFDGFITTLWICVVSISIGVFTGLGVALLRLMKIPIVDQLLGLYISLARATPLVTLTLFIFLSSNEFGLNLPREVASILALTLNTTAFNAEIWKTSFLTFSKEQQDASLAYGMTDLLHFRRILLPQALISSLPGLINEMSFIIKSSPAVAIIGVADLTRISYQIGNETYEPLPPILAASLFYMLFIGCILKIQSIAEKNASRLAM